MHLRISLVYISSPSCFVRADTIPMVASHILHRLRHPSKPTTLILILISTPTPTLAPVRTLPNPISALAQPPRKVRITHQRNARVPRGGIPLPVRLDADVSVLL